MVPFYFINCKMEKFDLMDFEVEVKKSNGQGLYWL